jgi:hypothetical protein
LGEERFCEEVSRNAGENEERKAKRKPIKAIVKEFVKRLGTTPKDLKGKDCRRDAARKRAEAVAFDSSASANSFVHACKPDRLNVGVGPS